LQIHRPDFLASPDEIAAAFQHLAEAGKVREFGVSNYRPSQLKALQNACPFKLCVHQIECSLLQRAALHDGTLDQCLAEKLAPFAWSPLGGGQLADRAGDLLPSQREYQPQRVLPLLDKMAAQNGTTRSVVALAWLLKHPSGIVPIIGTTDPARIKNSLNSLGLELSHEEWYALLSAAEPVPLP
jgi:predicted oxidoreductase